MLFNVSCQLHGFIEVVLRKKHKKNFQNWKNIVLEKNDKGGYRLMIE
jgi:hypothetical protein